MNGLAASIFSKELYARIGIAAAPVLIDVRRGQAFVDGLLAISYGTSANVPDDHEMRWHGLALSDVFCTWCHQ